MNPNVTEVVDVARPTTPLAPLLPEILVWYGTEYRRPPDLDAMGMLFQHDRESNQQWRARE